MCVPIISLNKVGRAIMLIIAPDIDVFILFASVEIQTHDVDITQFGSEVISVIKSISVKVTCGAHMRGVVSYGVHP